MRAARSRRPREPRWPIRALDRASLARSPRWVFGVAAVTWLSILLVYHALALGVEAIRSVGLEVAWFEGVHVLMIAYTPAALVYGLRGARLDLHALRPALRLSEAQFRDRLRALVTFNGAHLVSLTALLVAVSQLPLFVGPSPSPSWPEGRPPLGDPRMTWIMLRSAVVVLLLAPLVYTELTVARRFSNLGETCAAVDLLDPTRLAPFARHGLRSVLIWTGLTVLTSLLFLVSWAQSTARVALVLILVAATAVMLLPVRGVHRRLREEKQSELERVRAALRAERDAQLSARAGAGGTSARLANLIAYEQRIESARTWPFDPGTLLRFALYVTLGVGSWLGGAVVERLLGLLLD
ncbi:MAG: hypothetical protein JSU66_00040 [Deltaproteobacteria bacterium]|nr:MAG: hypothetical protein JSU66_00040 [Deltaproteobacteria bacterium]